MIGDWFDEVSMIYYTQISEILSLRTTLKIGIPSRDFFVVAYYLEPAVCHQSLNQIARLRLPSYQNSKIKLFETPPLK